MHSCHIDLDFSSWCYAAIIDVKSRKCCFKSTIGNYLLKEKLLCKPQTPKTLKKTNKFCISKLFGVLWGFIMIYINLLQFIHNLVTRFEMQKAWEVQPTINRLWLFPLLRRLQNVTECLMKCIHSNSYKAQCQRATNCPSCTISISNLYHSFGMVQKNSIKSLIWSSLTHLLCQSPAVHGTKHQKLDRKSPVEGLLHHFNKVFLPPLGPLNSSPVHKFLISHFCWSSVHFPPTCPSVHPLKRATQRSHY